MVVRYKIGQLGVAIIALDATGPAFQLDMTGLGSGMAFSTIHANASIGLRHKQLQQKAISLEFFAAQVFAGMSVTYTLALMGTTFRWTAAGCCHEPHGSSLG